MDKRNAAGMILAALSFFAAGIIVFQLAAPEKPRCPGGGKAAASWRLYRTSFRTMGTIAAFSFYADSQQRADAGAQTALAEFEAVNRIANLYDPSSELSRLNATAGQKPFVCSNTMWLLLMRAEKAYLESDGNFDITIKPLMLLWGFYRKSGTRPPTDAEIESARAKVGFDKLRFDRRKQTVFFTIPGMALDLGGIAKGLAAERAAGAIVQKSGIRAGVIDLGGNLKMLPEPPPGREYYIVAIRDPADRRRSLPQKLHLPGGSAAATSGDYERFVVLQGKRYAHIISPKSGMPEAKNAVTVTTGNAMDADILSTTLYLNGENFAPRIQKLYPGCGIYFTPRRN